ncbi:MAG: glycoside hydrolase family 3 C-terminal domain-containing protein [Janthinobacterium lividum]
MRLVAALPLLFVALSAAAQTSPAYLNPALPPPQRAADLVGRMTLEEKSLQMVNGAAAIPRLNVPAYDYWNEGLHGVARSGYATMFPQAIGMAATWDAPLLKGIGDVIATEARAKNNEALRHGNHDIYFGLTFWSPNINIFRDPRWGRGQETYGEDPHLTAQLGVNFIQGLQGNDPKYYKVIATPKHFAVHSGPEDGRHKFDVEPTPHDLWDTYLPQFRAAIVDAKADSIMCAYNRVDGQPACGSKLLLVDILRNDWNFNGFVTSDCGAIDDFFRPNTHQTEPDAEHADKAALLAGTDTNCGSTYRKLGDAVKAGLIQESDIDVSLRRLFEARIRLGLFDPPASVPYAQIPFSEVNSPAHAALAKRAAEESVVLLKNDGILPLRAGKYKTVAVIGPNAASLSALEGNYNGQPHDPIMPVDAIRSALRGSTVVYAPGAPYVEGFAMPVSRTMLHPAKGSRESGLKAEYFPTNNFDGTPAVTRVDPEINFDWSGVSPMRNAPASPFAVRWSGTITAPAAGTYQFTIRTGRCRGCGPTQSYRLLVDGKEVTALHRTAPPASGGRINGTTGLPEVDRANKPGTFSITFDDTRQEHSFQLEFVRDSASAGSGLRLEWTPKAAELLPDALAAAKGSDLVIAMLGLSPDLEGEEMPVKLPGFAGGDRTDINLPASQQALLRSILDTGKPTVVVLLNGSAIAVNLADEKANAVLEGWYPGEAGSVALADTLVGRNNPSGRLPVTFYKSESDLPAFDDYSMKNRTYRYFTGTPLYSFGYGLSYTTYAYSGLKLSKNKLNAGETLTAEATVKNTGKMAGEEVAELYLLPPVGSNGGLSPKQQLQGFQRILLKPGESRKVSFTLTPRQLSEVDAQGVRSVSAGSYTIAVGSAQPGEKKARTSPQTAVFTIVGTQPLPH